MLLASCASQSAFYLRQYHLSLGINESSRRTAALAGDRMLSMFWMLHLAFAMLRVGDMDAALLNLDCLFMAFDARQYNKTAVSTVRGIALYHYLNGRLRSAHALLTGQAARGVSPNAPHVPFEDPLNLDMLYALEQAGFPPISRYPRSYRKKLKEGTNRQLRGAALRIEALRLRDRGGDPKREQTLLRESLTASPERAIAAKKPSAPMNWRTSSNGSAMRPRRRPCGIRRKPAPGSASTGRFLPADGPSFNPPFPGKQAPRPRRRALRLPAGLLRGTLPPRVQRLLQ
ncbi:MAG: hypothetical protein ACLR0N_13650 [Bilophila wadsworthia]